jgi:hypothetical protein
MIRITAIPKVLSVIAAGVLLVGATAAANASSYVVTIEQVGANVVATGSGSLDTNGLTAQSGDFGGGITPSLGVIDFSASPPLALSENFFSVTISGPTLSFGSGNVFEIANSGTGNFVGFDPTDRNIRVFSTYVSGSDLGTSTLTWNGEDFASLGITPGTYEWTYGTGGDTFTIEIGTTPLPAALPLFATGLGGLGLLGWRRKRKAQAV